MKKLILLCLISLSLSATPQTATFIRIYNLDGRIIKKGNVLSVTDTSIQMESDSATRIDVKNIGTIKTRRSAASNIIAGALTGGATLAILGAATAQPDDFLGYTAGEGAIGGLIVGLPLGAGIGALTLIGKKSKTYIIDGDAEKWKAIKSSIVIKKKEEQIPQQ